MGGAADQSLKFNYVSNSTPSRPVGFHSVLFCLFFKQVSLSDYSFYKSGLKIVGYSGFCLPLNKYKVYGKKKIPHICLCSNFYLASSSLPKNH